MRALLNAKVLSFNAEEDEDRAKKKERKLKRAFIGMTVYLIFIIPLTYAALSVASPSLMYHETRILKRVFLETLFNTTGNATITFYGITDTKDFWFFLKTALLDGVYTELPYESGLAENATSILVENRVLGVPRMRQLRVRNDSCSVHDSFKEQFTTCYDEYSREAEDTEQFGEFNYSEADLTRSTAYTGKIATYGVGGYLAYLGPDKKVSKTTLEELEKKQFITEATRCVFIDFAVYNANLNLFCVIKMIFEFPPSGGVIPSTYFNTIRFINTSKFVLTYKTLCVIFIVLFTLDALKDLFYLRWRYIKDIWSWLNIILICYAYLFLGTILTRNKTVENAVKENIDLIKDQSSEGVSWYANYEEAVSKQVTYNNMLAILLFLAYLKIFKYFSINKSMAQLNNTFVRCALDVIGFSIMFFIIFFAYAEFGYLIFGSQVEGFSTFGVSMFTLLRTILGDFNYMEMETANKTIAPIYFLTYIFLVFFVLLNMFLAIIIDTYSEVKNEIEMEKDGFKMSGYMKRLLFNVMRKCGCKKWIPKQKKTKTKYNILTEQIRQAQKNCGFTDLESEVFFQSHHIDPESVLEAFNFAKFMAELEKSTNLSPSDDVDHIATQYERLVKIEKVVTSLAAKVETMVKKLDRLDNVRRGAR